MVHSETMIELKSICFPVQSKKKRKKNRKTSIFAKRFSKNGKDIWQRQNDFTEKGARMNYGSICSGVEAATLAWAPLGWRAVFFAETEPFPAAVLQI